MEKSTTPDASVEAAAEPASLIVKIRPDEQGESVVYHISGRLDTKNMDVLRECLREHQAGEAKLPKHLILDLSKLEYICSMGFREVFLLGRKQSQAGGTMAVCGLQPSIRELFDIAQFQTAYPIYSGAQEALAHVRQGR